MSLFKHHLQRVNAALEQGRSLSETSKFILQNTRINDRPYSYVDHEYQETILNCDAQEIAVRKCSQVGLSEVSARKALALCGMLKNFTVIYTLPTATFARTFMTTRINPVIAGSPYLKEMATEIDNMEVKQLGNSFLYVKGAASANAPISIPADMLIHDELDFSDGGVISQYHSRLTHSPWKLKFRLSTPTIPGKGIDFEFQRSLRHYNFVKCSCCGFHFVPDYYEHVKIPGFSGDLRSITKSNLHLCAYKDAFVCCPKCGGKPDLGPENREWVIENASENRVAKGFQVSPFDAPKIITPGTLVEASTQYSDIADFVNFSLGLPYFSQETVLAPGEIEAILTNESWPGFHQSVMGVDLGKTCHIVIARVSFDGAMQVCHTETCDLMSLRDRYRELRLKYRVRMSVIDSLPYTDTVLSLQALDMNLYASVYTQSRGVELFTVKQRDAEEASGTQALRQINVHRDRTFDALMHFVRSGMFSKIKDVNDREFVEHCTDMRRLKDWDAVSQEVKFKWLKSETGNDHFWFALSYAFLAKHIVGASSNSTSLSGIPLVSKFKISRTPSSP